jgi:protein-disulfide isomerase
MNSRLDRLLSITLTAAAVAIVALLLRREFAPASAQGQPPSTGPSIPTLTENWREMLRHGTRVGSESAPVVIVEFSDLECPFCKRFHETALSSARARFGDKIALVFIDLPIPGHRFARPAARAAHCAGRQGRFGEYVEATFAKQDSLGLKAWTSIAVDAGVPDTSAFRSCNQETTALAVIDSGLAVGKRFNIGATPTVFVNGWRFPVPPTDSTLNKTIEVALKELADQKSPRREQ